MSYVQEVARDTLKSAHTELSKAKRTLLLVAGALALVHLLTVYPYLQASREIVLVETSMAENDRLLAQIEPEIARLRDAGDSTGLQLSLLLFSATDEMIASFAELRQRISWAMSGEMPDAPPDFPPDPYFTVQSGPPQIPSVQQTAPIGQQRPPAGPLFDPTQQMPANLGVQPSLTTDRLEPILAALVAEEPDAEDRLTTYARQTIVAAAYSRVQREWDERIRPAYLEALVAIEEQARATAESAPESTSETATALLAAADDIAARRGAVEAIEITHDATVDAAFGPDWWRTVQGKGAYADAVAESIQTQMQSIAGTAEAPSTAIRKSLALQEELRDQLRRQQAELESQFVEQRKQLASLSGTASVVPVDLASFIGLFPLVLGLVLSFMMLRAGRARQDGARAAMDLARAAPDDIETRHWLAGRMLGDGNPIGPLLVTGAVAIGALAWIGLATRQVEDSLIDPPLTPLVSGTIAAVLIVVAAMWDGAAIRRLAVQIRS